MKRDVCLCLTRVVAEQVVEQPGDRWGSLLGCHGNQSIKDAMMEVIDESFSYFSFDGGEEEVAVSALFQSSDWEKTISSTLSSWLSGSTTIRTIRTSAVVRKRSNQFVVLLDWQMRAADWRPLLYKNDDVDEFDIAIIIEHLGWFVPVSRFRLSGRLLISSSFVFCSFLTSFFLLLSFRWELATNPPTTVSLCEEDFVIIKPPLPTAAMENHASREKSDRIGNASSHRRRRRPSFYSLIYLIYSLPD